MGEEPAPVPTPAAPPAPAPPPRASTSAVDDGVDLFRTIGPVLVRRYALPAGAVLLALVVLVRVIRIIRR